MSVRTRVAPSPTGDPHLGTAYIALFNLCFARQHNGQCILRIEDTDQARSTLEYEQAIIDSLRWLGLTWDEGPDVGGDYGPYRQSQRSDRYLQYAEQLVEQGHAFYCYRRPDELMALRQALQQQGLNRALKYEDLALPADEQQARANRGESYVIRLHVPTDGMVEIQDMLRGTVTLDWAMIDAQILLKSNGMPTYHLANVVDDHLMAVTHVLRGEEWLNSAPKHQLLYQCFDWQMPQLCHLPLLRNPDKSKLSKRKNPTSVGYYQAIGYLPEALLNYLGHMGWSMPDGREKFSLADMITHFDIARVHLGGPVFDIKKLNWINGLWIRDELNCEDLAERLHVWRLNKNTLMKLLPHAQQRIETLSDFVPLTAFCASGLLSITEQSFAAGELQGDILLQVLQLTLWALDTMPHWHAETLFTAIKVLADGMELPVKQWFAPLFVAITGTEVSISVTDAMEIIGRDLSRARIRYAIEVLGGVSKKKAKVFEKTYVSLTTKYHDHEA